VLEIQPDTIETVFGGIFYVTGNVVTERTNADGFTIADTGECFAFS
jgi:hypothetical protein